MKSLRLFGSLIFIFLGLFTLKAQDNFSFQGQVSSWAHFNPGNTLTTQIGARYIPQLNFEKELNKNSLFDLELSFNAYGNMGLRPFDSTSTDGNIKPYRAWIRYSGKQFEIRAGLQKINFGSASMLRPLMWFDGLDPRDPLQLTDGVWGILGRYYFLNNANIWIWGLYGNNKPKGWEFLKTTKQIPEFGGRIQLPTHKGEFAASYHFRNTNSTELEQFDIPLFERIPEHRIGIDGKWDLEIGLWMEASWIHKTKDIGMFTNTTLVNIGADYTFGVGNGINIIAEQLIASFSQEAFDFEDAISFTAVSASYPFGLFDNLSTMVYYDWNSNGIYSFLNWQRSFDNWVFHLMAYWNPEDYNIPVPGTDTNLYAGKGIQIMIVFNH